jgi:hypothetical protein
MTKNMSRPVRYGLLAVFLTASLAACDSPKTETSGPATDVEDTTNNSSPEAEGTGPEQPGPENDEQSVSYPNLPAGEDDYDSSEVRQCLTVAWLGSTDVPDGVSVQVKTVRITPSGVFELAGSSCDGVQGCTDSFAFTSADESCSVSLEATASNGTEAFLRLAGRCVSQDTRQCDELLADDRSPISLYQPEPPTDEEYPEDPPSEEEPPSEESPPSG